MVNVTIYSSTMDPGGGPGGPKYDELGRRIDRQKKVSDSFSDEVQWRNADFFGCRQKKGIEMAHL